MSRRPKVKEYENPVYLLVHEGSGWDDRPVVLGVSKTPLGACSLIYMVIENKVLEDYRNFEFKDIEAVRGTGRRVHKVTYIGSNPDMEIACYFKIVTVELEKVLGEHDLSFICER